MKTQAAKDLVKETLENPFNQGKFSELIVNIFKEVKEDHRKPTSGNHIAAAFRDYISSVKRVASYENTAEDLKVDILVVKLTKKTSLERARATQRNFIADLLRKGGKNAALVAFVSPDDVDWRFSFVKMEYKVGKQGKIVEEFTPARRFSFLVGKHEKSHTAKSHLLPTLEQETNPTLEDLENIFNVETVTDEFFEKYRELFHRLSEQLDEIRAKDPKVDSEFNKQGIDTADFAKKLLGQIIFLYFLQKKGWLGVPNDKEWGAGSKNFLRELFDKGHGDYQNFFNDILRWLFYDALASPDPKYWRGRFSNCRIPFLNGGLFDPINGYDWKNTEILLPDHIFSNSNVTKEDDIGDGILNIFDRYNFTVNESEPLEREVAVDPEMLGKVFEKLLPIKDRQSGGTYYTHRDIVHHMCRESLANYLATELKGKVSKADVEKLIEYGEDVVENDSRVIRKGGETETYKYQLPKDVRKYAKLIDIKLDSIRVCDPAVGSGAFLVGMMNEIVRARNALTPHIHRMCNVLVPHIGESRERFSHKFKRQAIEYGLYGVDIDSSATEIAKLRLWLSLVVDEEDRNKIQPLPNLDYKVVQGNSLLNVERDMFNDELFERLEKLKPLYFKETDTDKKYEYRKEIDGLISQITGGIFDFEVYFSEIFHEKQGFDVVIANPPYVKKEHLEAKVIQQLEEFFNYEVWNREKKPVKNWSDDLYVHFIFKGVEIARKWGVMSYITNDSFIVFDSKRRIRHLLLGYDLSRLIKCPPETFDATIYTAIFTLQKSKSQVRGYETGCFSYPDFKYYELGTVPYEVVEIHPKRRLMFASPLMEIYKRLLAFPKIKDNLHVIDTGIDSGNVRTKLFFKKSNPQAQERLLQGKQIERWGVFWDSPKAKFQYCNIDYRPSPQKGIGRGGKLSKLDEYWNFRGDIDNHHQPERLLLRQSDDDLVAAYQNEKSMGRFYTDNTLFTVLPGLKATPLKYAMAILNSKLLNTLYHFLSQEEGKTLAQVKIGLVNELPFALGDQNSVTEIINIVDNILTITSTSNYQQDLAKQAQVHCYEKEIDKLVYKLYNLTSDEIRIIEEANNPK